MVHRLSGLLSTHVFGRNLGIEGGVSYPAPLHTSAAPCATTTTKSATLAHPLQTTAVLSCHVGLCQFGFEVDSNCPFCSLRFLEFEFGQKKGGRGSSWALLLSSVGLLAADGISILLAPSSRSGRWSSSNQYMHWHSHALWDLGRQSRRTSNPQVLWEQ